MHMTSTRAIASGTFFPGRRLRLVRHAVRILGVIGIIAVAQDLPSQASTILQSGSYSEDPFGFQWQFYIRMGKPLPTAPMFLSPIVGGIAGNTVYWQEGVQLRAADPDGVFDDLTISAQHLIDPHDSDDITGTRAYLRVKDLPTLPKTPIGGGVPHPQVLIIKAVDHADSEGKHYDNYKLSYWGSGEKGIHFILSGTHSSTPAPEPATFFLLGLGTLSIVFCAHLRGKNASTP